MAGSRGRYAVGRCNSSCEDGKDGDTDVGLCRLYIERDVPSRAKCK